jgi:hypothetical protein
VQGDSRTRQAGIVDALSAVVLSLTAASEDETVVSRSNGLPFVNSIEG